MEVKYFQQYAERTSEIAKELHAKGIPFITAMVMAGDQANMENVDRLFNEDKLTFDKALLLIGSYSRFDWFVKQWKLGVINDRKFYKLLPDVWTSSDPDDKDPNYLDIWRRAFVRNGKTAVIDGDKLPKKAFIKIYRGQSWSETFGFSWTTNYDIAVKFANGASIRQPLKDGMVYEAEIHRDQILAYLTTRNEYEIICNPNSISGAENIRPIQR